MKNQGRSKRQVENNYKIVFYTFISAFILIIIILITKAFNLW